MLILGFTTAPSYAIEVVSCSGFEACPDGSPPFTNAFLELAAEVEALTAEVEVLKALLAGVTRVIDPDTSQDTMTFTGMNVQVVNGTGLTATTNGAGDWAREQLHVGFIWWNGPGV